jgi:hypothetical protein
MHEIGVKRLFKGQLVALREGDCVSLMVLTAVEALSTYLRESSLMAWG